MSYIPFHHKYRPQTFAELVGQDAIALTLTHALTRQRLAPAYLFAGLRGTGKTSSARILAKSLNCLQTGQPTPTPCGNCEVCRSIAKGSALDVIEIDAASNSGVENMRDLIEASHFSPVQCRYKVYIIDEVHGLSGAAFQALLKITEHPPANVVFILCTTERQKVPPTIQSRCQCFTFRPIGVSAIASHLQEIATQEKIEITPNALTLIARLANGALRDAERLLDQLSLLPGTIDIEQVQQQVGLIPEQDLLELMIALATGNPDLVLQQAQHLLHQGLEPRSLVQGLAQMYLHLLTAKTSANASMQCHPATWEQLVKIAPTWQTSTLLKGLESLRQSEQQLKQTTQPHLWLEVSLLNLLPQPSPVPDSDQIQKDNHRIETVRKSSPQPSPLHLTDNMGNPPDLTSVWTQVMQSLAPAQRTLLAQHGEFLGFNGHHAKVKVSSPPLRERLHGSREQLEAAFTRVVQTPVTVELVAN